ncbi:hypothetical protein DPMN_187185 [Dreissena polymorpha]|uniref:Uncharacterized protein n=1 Tax=Dreissena polymorpha TaxID=45954 RepID=A0A9D4DNJ6_DREPO|nr:hypothetical protein DPMN_187185 [Dreissena polymorpha]
MTNTCTNNPLLLPGNAAVGPADIRRQRKNSTSINIVNTAATLTEMKENLD